jgi:acetyl-CoA acetyltransferase/uncharacterized OB-fold protein
MSSTPAGAAIAGLGMTSLGRVYGSSPRRLAANAVRAAVADAGMTLGDLDGLLICPGISGGLDIGLAGQLGLRDLALLAVMNSFGASAAVAVQTAALAVTSGAARAVACVFADTPLREGMPAGSAFGNHGDGSGGPSASQGDGAAGGGGSGTLAAARQERHGLGGLAAGYGFRSVTVYYALAAQRHMQAFGTTSEQLGAIAVAQRQWAAGNPLAQFRDPITLADHQRSRWVAEPLHLLDCSLVSNGAIAVIVTSAAAAQAGPRPPVYVWGAGQGHPGWQMSRGSGFGLITGAAQAGRTAMTMARVNPADITMCQIYDCYTYTVLVTLEDYGFCGKGEGGPFVASGALAPGGSLPVNTGGGQLSGYYMWGFTPLSEAVIQARNDGGDRQCTANDLILVSGNGGILSHHGTLLVSPHQPAHTTFRTQPGPATRVPAGTAAAADGNLVQRPIGAVQPTSTGQATSENQSASALEVPAPPDLGVVRADERSEPFFAAAARGELLIKRCTGCAGWLGPAATACPACGADALLEWARASAAGTLVSWAIVHSRDGDPVAVPALVELAEGPWLSTGLHLTGSAGRADAPGEVTAVRAGMAVSAAFVRPPEGECYPVFRPLCTPGEAGAGRPAVAGRVDLAGT